MPTSLSERRRAGSDDPPSPFASVMRLVNGFQISQAVHVVAVLGIADLLAAGPRTIDDLADATDTDAEALYRLMRALAAAAVFHKDAARRFSLGPMGECLRSDAADPAGPWAAFIGRPYIWQAWSHLMHSVRTDETAFPSVHGESVWEYRAAHPEEGAIFDAAMTALSKDVAAGVVAVYDFAPFSRAVDVGGGQGALLGGILAANPALQGVVFDQPHVVARARSELDRLGVADRCDVVAGHGARPGAPLLRGRRAARSDRVHAGVVAWRSEAGSSVRPPQLAPGARRARSRRPGGGISPLRRRLRRGVLSRPGRH